MKIKPTRAQWTMTAAQIDKRIAAIETQLAGIRNVTREDVRQRYVDRGLPAAIIAQIEGRPRSPLDHTPIRPAFRVTEDDLVGALFQYMVSEIGVARDKLTTELGRLDHVRSCRASDPILAAMFAQGQADRAAGME